MEIHPMAKQLTFARKQSAVPQIQPTIKRLNQPILIHIRGM